MEKDEVCKNVLRNLPKEVFFLEPYKFFKNTSQKNLTN